MANTFELATLPQNCWNQIGVWGDGSCPELPRVSHCRNCNVYASSGRRLLDRPATADYIESWTATLAEERVAAGAATSPHLIFRIGRTWLAFPAASLREITEPTTIRTVPHRPRDVLRGLVNVRGELYPCVSLHNLFGEEETAPAPRTARFLVAHGAGNDWVFPADEIYGMHEVAEKDLQPLPRDAHQSRRRLRPRTARCRRQNRCDRQTKTLLFGTLVRRIA
jgi:chemotaxis-related protein WspD